MEQSFGIGVGICETSLMLFFSREECLRSSGNPGVDRWLSPTMLVPAPLVESRPFSSISIHSIRLFRQLWIGYARGFSAPASRTRSTARDSSSPARPWVFFLIGNSLPLSAYFFRRFPLCPTSCRELAPLVPSSNPPYWLPPLLISCSLFP